MFEKEAEEYSDRFEWTNDDRIIDYSKQSFKDGAEFGYNKANSIIIIRSKIMFNIIEILFLIFGWVFHIKGLVIASLVVSAVFLILLILNDAMKWSENKGSKPATFIQIICLALSIIKLCMW